ncbi:hypothetical protein BD309DRAFT_739417 [Dichomitus squalens]|nr:hypothetical protein BD309DRAFT_739417 [Dichomitus squalens]
MLSCQRTTTVFSISDSPSVPRAYSMRNVSAAPPIYAYSVIGLLGVFVGTYSVTRAQTQHYSSTPALARSDRAREQAPAQQKLQTSDIPCEEIPTRLVPASHLAHISCSVAAQIGSSRTQWPVCGVDPASAEYPTREDPSANRVSCFRRACAEYAVWT